MVRDLAGKRILLTGARSGIGAAVLTGLLQTGARVYAHFGRAEVTEDIAESDDLYGIDYGDIGDASYPPALVANAVKNLSGLDGIVHVAGGIERAELDHSFDPAVAARMFQQHVTGSLQLASAAKAHLAQSSCGFVVFVGSVAARTGGSAGVGVYAAAKSAVHSITRSVALDFAPAGIRVNAVAPGVIDTPFHGSTDPDVLDALAAKIPLGRLGEAGDCVGPICFLCSAWMSGYVTGHVLDVNGGMVMA